MKSTYKFRIVQEWWNANWDLERKEVHTGDNFENMERLFHAIKKRQFSARTERYVLEDAEGEMILEYRQ